MRAWPSSEVSNADCRWRRYAAEASTGETRSTSAGAPQGRIGAVRRAPP
jgi:hypothetical protein